MVETTASSISIQEDRMAFKICLFVSYIGNTQMKLRKTRTELWYLKTHNKIALVTCNTYSRVMCDVFSTAFMQRISEAYICINKTESWCKGWFIEDMSLDLGLDANDPSSSSNYPPKKNKE